ncbi:MAG TPA: prefoldin subunit alpha [Candidatus Thermoplasmatota archaeon]|nr:prefoldin subunit alpha [Candidatus Thermoplasmatota archaeon]
MAAAAPDPRQLMAQMDLIQRELQRAERRLAALEQAMVEAQQALGTVRHLAESGGVQQALLPIGGGLHVRAIVDATQDVLLPIGAGYSTPGKPVEVAKALEERVASLGRAYEEAAGRADELANAAAALNEQLPP